MTECCGSRPPRVAVGVELHRPVRDGDAERRADGAFDQGNRAAVGADQLGGDGEPKAGAAGAVRALERLEQMLARPWPEIPARCPTPRSPPPRPRGVR